MTSDPRRLLDLGDVTDVERDLLMAGRSAAPVDYDVAAGAARFRAELAALVAAGTATAVGTGAARSGSGALKGLFAKLGVKIALGVMAGATFAGAGVVAGMHVAQAPPALGALTRSSSPSALVVGLPVAAPSVAAPSIAALARSSPSLAATAPLPPAATPAPASVPTLPSLTRAAARRAPVVRTAGSPHRSTEAFDAPSPKDTESVDLSAAATASPRAASPTPTAPAAAPPSTPPPAAAPSPPVPPESMSEIRGVALARKLVVSDPQAALDVLDQVRRDHPNGYFVEERQALTVLALARVGRESAARQQAGTFLRAYPNGPFSDQVRSVATP
jgi:hypothetical protein